MKKQDKKELVDKVQKKTKETPRGGLSSKYITVIDFSSCDPKTLDISKSGKLNVVYDKVKTTLGGLIVEFMTKEKLNEKQIREKLKGTKGDYKIITNDKRGIDKVHDEEERVFTELTKEADKFKIDYTGLDANEIVKAIQKEKELLLKKQENKDKKEKSKDNKVESTDKVVDKEEKKEEVKKEEPKKEEVKEKKVKKNAQGIDLLLDRLKITDFKKLRGKDVDAPLYSNLSSINDNEILAKLRFRKINVKEMKAGLQYQEYKGASADMKYNIFSYIGTFDPVTREHIEWRSLTLGNNVDVPAFKSLTERKLVRVLDVELTKL